MSNTRAAAGTASQAALLLIARLIFAAILVARAWSRWQIEGIDAQVSRLAQANLPAPEILAWGTIALEGIGGVLLAFGLLTRLIATLIATQNILIIVFLRWTAGPFMNAGGFEYNAALACLGIVFLATGASYTGLDSLFFRRRKTSNESTDLYQPKLGSTQY
ncbi:DoxX family protein [Brooklawnia sp.]|uniref:DoxX family protein n=1 Tax=Brooklawnia sp. TaxID=2699740 RepID=UPI0031202989